MTIAKKVTFDVSGLIPEAQAIAREVAAIYWKHTHPWFVGLVCFGSAVKGGVIPGASDIDFHLNLAAAAFTATDVLRLDIALAIQADLAQINPAPFRYIDGGAETGRLPEGHIGPIPGTYHLIAGREPMAEATLAQVQAQARWSLARLDPLPAFVSEGLLQHGTGRGQLALTVRTLCQTVWPTLYHVCCLRQADAIRVWQLPKPAVIALLPPDEPLGRTIRTFNQAVWRYYPLETSLADAFQVIQTGVDFLQAVKDWATDFNIV
ncbi:MAG: hypothetical protein DYG89_36375 [Caldilinea sp. CFX5]|nr:hypothetical protein [Caldilinea sp. CFX5]